MIDVLIVIKMGFSHKKGYVKDVHPIVRSVLVSKLNFVLNAYKTSISMIQKNV